MVNSSLICLAEEILGSGDYMSVHSRKAFLGKLLLRFVYKGHFS